MKRYVADFETTTELSYNIDGCTRVWAYAIVDIDTNEVIDVNNNIDDFFKTAVKLSPCELYFHNLKFDGGFIIDYLFKNGWRFSEKRKAHTFNTLIDKMGAFYSMEITIEKYKRRYKSIKIYDSLKKLPLKVSQIAKAFDLPLNKLEIDYDEYREVGHTLTDKEREYVIADCLIVAMALKQQFDTGLDKMTIGSDSLTGFKKTMHPSAFSYYYPKLDRKTDERIRASYKGGWTYLNPIYANKRLKGMSFDVNSLYPTVMYGNMGLLPVVEPLEFDGEYQYDKHYPLYILEFEAKFKVKPNYLPTIQLKGSMYFSETEYITDSKEVVTLCLTSVDFELFKKHYDIEYIKVYGGFKFKGVDDLFRPYIDYWSNIKATSTGGKRQLAKLMLNSLYGKFGTNPLKQSKIPYYEDGKVAYNLSAQTYDKPVYTALASFVTSYARAYTITTAQNNITRFIYADTDSIYIVGYDNPIGINIHPTLLGAWKCEGKFIDSLFIRSKTYLKTMEDEPEKIEVKCAGMPEVVKSLVTYDNFRIGASFDGKLLPKRVEGGIILKDTQFTIKS